MPGSFFYQLSKKLFLVVPLLLISLLLARLIFLSSIVHAAVTEAVATTSTVMPNQTIKASSTDTPVIKFRLTGDNADNTVTQVSVKPVSTAGPAVAADILNFKVWKSADSALDGGDTLVGTQTTIATMGSATNITVTDTIGATSSFYIVTVATSSALVSGHAFRVDMAANAITAGGTGGAAIGSALTATNSLTGDTVAPTFNSNQSGPQNNSTNVPISTFIHQGFNENLDQMTLNSSNISLCSGSACGSGGTAVGTAIRPFPNGFDLVVSDKPTYASGSNFAKLTTAGQGFYFLQGTNPVMPQGSYVLPTNGDIVYFQHETFPAELGVVTNNTLTSGTFSINNFNLFGPQMLVKVASPAATGAVSGTTAVTTGDLIVLNSSANPTDSRYNWHLVTTGAAINNSGLRIDGAGAAPTFIAGSSFSTMTPTATVTDNGVTADGTLAVSVGDLVFAKVGSNAYGWHVVTGAGNLSSDTTEATASLDNLSAANSKVANSSQISKLSSAAQGLVTDTTTVLSFGDIVFAKATANAANTGVYAFHLVSAGATGASSNSLRFDNASSNLSTGTTYVITVGTGVKDSAGNALASAVNTSFSTGSTGSANTTPPFVQSSTPQPGNQSFPISAPIKLQFSVPMEASATGTVTSSSNIGLFLDSFGGTGTVVAATNTYDSATNTVTITPSAPLTASTGYLVKVNPTTLSATGVASQNYSLNFRAGGGSDTSRPTINGTFPSAGATGVVRPVGDIAIGFSEDVDASTITSSSVTINNSITGTVTYNPQQRAAHFSPSIPLSSNTTYTVTVAATVKDLSNNLLGGNGGVANAASSASSNTSYVFSFTTAAGADDTAAPSVQFANADNFGVAVTFNEPMKNGGGPNAVDNIANYTLESPVGSSISLGGKTITYDSQTMTARISGLSLQNGSTFKITASNLVQDVSGNGVSTSGTPAGNVAQGTVANSSQTGGQLGPGSGPQQSAAEMGMSPIRVNPMTRLAGATSNYSVEFPVATSIPLGGTIVLTFPSGFDVTNAAAMTAGTESPANSDINGPSAGTVTIASVANNASARTITITTAGAATGANTFLRFDLKNIVNSTVPNSSGYTVDIKTKDASGVILTTMTSGSFFLGQAGSNTLTVNVFNDNGAGGGTADNKVKDGTEPNIDGVKVFLFSPATGGTNKTTASGNSVSFTSLSDGDYMLGFDPSTIGSFFGNSAPQPIRISGSPTINIGLNAATLVISGTITGPANTDLDVFASSQNGFSKTSVTIGGGGTVAYSLPAQANTTYNVNVGPKMPDMQPGSTSFAPPTFNFMPPAPLTVAVTNASRTGQNITLATAGRTITGTVKDSGGIGINGAQVFARPAQTSTNDNSAGFGSGAQTASDGSFTINVTAGNYIVGVFKPGMPSGQDQQISVPTSGATTPATLNFKLDASTTSLTISGKVTDDAGNAIPYAGVGGRKVVSTTDSTPLGGDSSNFVGGPTDANGAYTMYVSAGTWVVDAFAPNFGKLGSKTITVGSSSLTGQDFSAATLNTGAIKGQVTKASVAQQGAMVRAFGANGENFAVTDSSGNYSLKVPAGTYTVSTFLPGVGEATPLTGVAVTANTDTTGQNFAISAPITITVQLTDGTNPITGAFVDVRDVTTGRGNGTGTSTISGANAVYTVVVPPGTYTVRAGNQTYGPLGSTASVSTTQTITYTASAGVTYAVTGTVTGDGSALANAWVSISGTPTGQTNFINLGGQTASNGTFSINVPNGTYNVRVDRPGFKSPPTIDGVVVNGATYAAGTIALTTSTLAITGTVTLSGSGVSNAFVDAVSGNGGFAVAQTDTTGAYSLPVDAGTWTLRAHSMGYEGGPLTVTVGSSNSTNNAITLSAISGFTVRPEKQETVTPTAGTFLTNSDIGSGFRLNIPANALGTSSNASTVTTQSNTALPNPPTGSILSKSAVSIDATDSSGQPIKSLSDSVTIVLPYNESDLPSGTSESSLVIGVYNATTQNYDTLATTVDTVNNTLTATTTHFSDFAPLIPASNAPSTPTGLAAVAASMTNMSLSWTAVSGATSYDIYRSATSNGTYARLGSEPTVGSGSTTTYTDTLLTAGTTYYYKISALNLSGESASSSAVSATTNSIAVSSGGGSPVLYTNNSSNTATQNNTVTTTTPSAAEIKAKAIADIRAQIAQLMQRLAELTSKPNRGQITKAFIKVLGLGSKGEEVSQLQSFLKSQGKDIYPEGIVSGEFKGLTKKAIERFQIKHQIAMPGDVGYGSFGPKTRAKANELMAE